MKKKNQKILIKLIILMILLIISPIIENKVKEYNISETELRTIEEIEEKDNKIEDNFQIYFIDVGQADCILIKNNKEYALIDAGNNEDGKKLVSYFQQLKINSFQYLIATHPHEDHIGGMDDIINNFQVEHILMPDVIVPTKSFEDLLDSIEKKKKKIEIPKIDDTFQLENTTFQVLWIGKEEEDINDTSIVLKVTYKNTSYLLTGDATNNVERQILEKDLKSDVLKIGHHGSQYSTSAHFLKKVNPKYAIIEVGKNNDYGHPKEIILKKLEKIGAKIYRTDQDGTIIATSDGNTISFDTIKTDTNG